jgi:hypothetical protein
MWTLTIVFCLAMSPMQPIANYCKTKVMEDIAPSFPQCVVRAYGLTRMTSAAVDRIVISARCDRQRNA